MSFEGNAVTSFEGNAVTSFEGNAVTSFEGNAVTSTAKAVTDASFDADVLASPRPVIVEYWAPWCGPCRMVSPVLDEIAAEYAGRVDVVKVNTDENPQSMIKYGVMAVPTINLFSGGEVVKQVIGAKSKSALLREFADFLA